MGLAYLGALVLSALVFPPAALIVIFAFLFHLIYPVLLSPEARKASGRRRSEREAREKWQREWREERDEKIKAGKLPPRFVSPSVLLSTFALSSNLRMFGTAIIRRGTALTGRVPEVLVTLF